MNIEFVERESYIDHSICIAPTFMVKDGIEYFVWNRICDDKWNERENGKMAAELVANGGKYFRFSGSYSNPLEMLEDMKAKGYTLSNPDELLVDCTNYGGFVDFNGGYNEVSAVFYYRIYDKQILDAIKMAIASR